MTEAPVKNPQPNILFLLSDQHTVSAMSDVNDNPVRTPNLDALSRSGVRFDNAYCQNPLCVPSRSSLITGQYSRNTGIYDNQHILPSNGETLARTFSQAGYRTALIGKSHFNGEQFQGYQERPYGDFFGQAHQPDPARTPDKGESGLGDILADAGPSGIPISLTQTEICVAEASRWLQSWVSQNSGSPFFLSVHFDKPHFPINPPQQHFDALAGHVALPDYPQDWLDKASPFVSSAVRYCSTSRHRHDSEVNLRALTAYYGCVEWVDDAIGRILDTLGYLGLDDNTIVVYASDHGEMAARRGMWQKSVFFEDSARVPLIIRAPGACSPGLRSSQLVGLIDLYPTLCKSAGIAMPAHLDGVDLGPALRNGSLARSELFCETSILKHPDQAGCMLRREQWKYCLYLDGYEELYDMTEDPGEWLNLALLNEYQDLCRDLRERVVTFFQPEQFAERYARTPRMPQEKHFYPFSNQFMGGNGVIFDARP